MIPLEQKYLHTDNQHGDCWRTCIASILECDIDTFPYHNGDISWPDEYDEVMRILESMGWNYYSLTISQVREGFLNSQDTDGYVLAIGSSLRGCNHSVIWKNGIVHDPHPDKSGLENIIRFEILQKIEKGE